MFYTIYKIINNINGKIYIGAHQTEELNDNYMGSGDLIKKAIKKYGVNNFIKENIHVFDNPKDMYKMESVLVNGDFIKRKDTYNIRIGGTGGFSAFESKLAAEKFKWLIDNDPVFLERIKKINSENMKKYYQTNPPRCTFTGKKHTEKTKQKMSKSHKGKGKGKTNSQYGTCWIYSLKENISKKIKKEELQKYIADGWNKGRKIK